MAEIIVPRCFHLGLDAMLESSDLAATITDPACLQLDLPDEFVELSLEFLVMVAQQLADTSQLAMLILKNFDSRNGFTCTLAAKHLPQLVPVLLGPNTEIVPQVSCGGRNHRCRGGGVICRLLRTSFEILARFYLQDHAVHSGGKRSCCLQELVALLLQLGRARIQSSPLLVKVVCTELKRGATLLDRKQRPIELVGVGLALCQHGLQAITEAVRFSDTGVELVAGVLQISLQNIAT
mmetsp:Transcript_43134/g.125591  ORF Transcript_43134/g.125591 Transcript_43134/m.125591 type:complete len:237 (-) Transcript_43134:1697-2407(-)